MVPAFSIIMPTYNRAYCIENAIQSVIAQSYPKWELIIVDDGSVDNTAEIIQKLAQTDQRICYIKSEHVGVSHARNLGILQAKNDWIAYLDSDNVLSPNFLAVFAYHILKQPNVKSFYSKMKCRKSNIVFGQKFDFKQLCKSNFIDLGVYVHSKDLFEKYHGFDEDLTRLVDWDLILNYSQHSIPYFIDAVLLSYNDSRSLNRISLTQNYSTNYTKIKIKHKI